LENAQSVSMAANPILGPEAYTGPSVGEMLRCHTLAQETIARHDDPCPIFDSSELKLLGQYVMKPSQRETLLRERDMLDPPGTSTQQLGCTANKKGSLMGYVIARQTTEDRPLRDGDMEMLKEWFESGKVDEALKQEGRWKDH